MKGVGQGFLIVQLFLSVHICFEFGSPLLTDDPTRW
ncbi:hypothetical protein N806_03325 [Rhodococcus sp. P27]|nr:hypothetical protein N806_03325 [Rhodococcus sp. P27]